MLRTWKSRLLAAGGIALAVAIFALLGWRYALAWHPALHDYPIQGTDLSADNGDVDFPTLRAAGADFVYLRATYAGAGRDVRFADYWRDAREAGLRRGAIHVFSFCRPAIDQANDFITTVPRYPDALPAALSIDFADDCPDRPAKAVLVTELERFLTMVETHTGKPMLLKISRRVESEYGLSAAIPRTVWATRFFFQPRYSTSPWRMWQASGFRRVDGVSTPVNWDVVAP